MNFWMLIEILADVANGEPVEKKTKQRHPDTDDDSDSDSSQSSK